VDARALTTRILAGAWSALGPIDRVLVGCVSATLVSLVRDYRLGLAPVLEEVLATPFSENAGRAVVFEQLVGWHAIVWLAAGAAMLASARYRRGMLSLPAVLLVAMALAIPVVTAATTGVDRLTLESLFGIALPLAAMVALALHPDVGELALRLGIWIIAICAGALTLATVGKQLADGSLDRLGILFFGPTTSTGPVLAALVILVLMLLPAHRVGRLAALCLVVILAAGVALSQSRAAALALLAGLGIAATRERAMRRWFLLAGAALALVALMLAPRSLLSAAQSTSLKLESIRHHWTLFLERPSFGYGVSKQALPAAGGADSSLLGIANGIGAYAVVAFLGSWCAALSGLPWRAMAFGGAILAVYVVAWLGGGEILVQIPVTNLLPLALACGLARKLRESATTAKP
jgi:hypothetical protein